MNKLLLSWPEYIDEIKKIGSAKNRKFLYISSYGLGKQDTLKQEITELNPDKLLIGLSFHECKIGCSSCKTSGILRERHIRDFERESNLNLKIVKDLHLKAVITAKGAIIGGINMTESNWTDSALVTDDTKIIKKLKQHFETAWKENEEYSWLKYREGQDYVFNFGKYKGFGYKAVKKVNPQYIEFCAENMQWFKNDLKLFKLI